MPYEKLIIGGAKQEILSLGPLTLQHREDFSSIAYATFRAYHAVQNTCLDAGTRTPGNRPAACRLGYRRQTNKRSSDSTTGWRRQRLWDEAR